MLDRFLPGVGCFWLDDLPSVEGFALGCGEFSFSFVESFRLAISFVFASISPWSLTLVICYNLAAI